MFWACLLPVLSVLVASTCSPGEELVDGACTACGDGTFESNGTCYVCPAGKYADVTGLTECYECSMGTYLSDDGVNWKLHTLPDLCVPCPRGRASNATGAAECQECTPGRYSDFQGNSECYQCYWGAAAENGAVECSACTPGYGPNSDYTACEQCAAGKYSNDGYGCWDCWGGHISEAGSTTTGCDACPAGKYVPYSYPSGGYGSGSGSGSSYTYPYGSPYRRILYGTSSSSGTAQEECLDCPGGRYSYSGSSDCYPCWSGTAAPNGSAACVECSPGTYAGYEASECSNCSAGTFSYPGSDYCVGCGWGTVSSEGDASCTACPMGQYANENLTQCLECDAGRYKGAFDSFCYDCSWGFYSNAGSAGCEACPAGTIGTQNRTHCDPCEAGKYNEWSAGTSCYDCWSVVSEDRTSCDSCPAGKALVTASPNYCEDCSPGRYSLWSGSYSCQACPLGRYSNEIALSELCSACPGLATENTSSTSVESCILPTANQSFECPKGKPCSVAGLEGSGLQNNHRLMIKYASCESAGGPTGSTYPYGNINIGGSFGYGTAGSTGFFGRRLETSGTAVIGFGFDGISSRGSADYNWEGSLVADVGTYRVCWCGGVTTWCDFDYNFPVDAGSMTVMGPYPDQQFACVLGRLCRDVGPLLGLGLHPGDQIHLRELCVAELAFVISVPLNVSANSSGDDVALFFSQDSSATLQEEAGEYALCWCSFQGQNCNDMQISEAAAASGNMLYLESDAGTLVIQGPAGGESIYCYKGQTCTATLSNGGTTLLAGDRLSFMQQCGGDFLGGLPTPGYADTLDGSSFSFTPSAAGEVVEFLESEPGMFRVCWCRADASMNMDCQKGSDFNVVAGLFLAVGPYSGQTRQCMHGQQCVITGLRGVSLSATDKLTPLSSCANSLLSQTFPSWPPPLLSSTLDASTGSYQFDLGQLDLQGVPEELELCWCGVSPSSCSDAGEYRAVAVTLSVACAAGWYDLRGNRTVCRRCLPGYYCPGGWPAPLLPCPAGKTSVANSSTSEACECREGYQWDASAGLCSQCPSGSFKDFVGNEDCNGTCPVGTTSHIGATRISQCYCEGEGSTVIDSDPAEDAFTCTDLTELSGNISGILLVSTRAVVSSFSGALLVLDASTEGLVQQIHASLTAYLGFGGGAASTELQPGWNGGVWYFNYSITTAEESLAREVRAKLEPDVFAAWVFTEMRGTPLDSAHVTAPSNIARASLQCPPGLGLPGGTFVATLSDCRCPYGMQLQSTGGLAGCVKCAVGTYSSVVSDAACTQCVAGGAQLTTLFEGAISEAACTCSAGLVNVDPENPSNCEECGLGSFCLGGAHRQECGESQTTTGVVATSEDQCLCAAGFFNELGICNACAPGRFKPEVANTQCAPCAAGNFSDAGQSQCDVCQAGSYSTGGMATCELCPAGRYLEDTAATSSDACLPCPVGKWSNVTGLSVATGCVECVTGSTTVLDGAANESMCVQPHSAETRSCTSGWICTVEGVTGSRLQDGHRLAITISDCASAKSPVTGIANSGISKLATDTGSRYVWGDSSADFIPQGGFTNLCWCANIGDLTCEGLNSNFWLSAGTLLIVGPIENTFTCVRGRDCLDLQPFSGYGLMTQDHVRIQRDSCGAASAVEISVANPEGTGSFQSASSADSFVNLTLGFGSTDADNDFHVQIDANLAGYLLCWCGSRGSSTACADPMDYVVYAGRLSILGPSTNQEKGCAVGQQCEITGVLGASVVPGDKLMILSDCGRGNAILGFPAQGILDSSDGTNFAFADGEKILLSVPGFPDLQNPIVVEEGADGLTVNLGTLPFGALPGTYQLCWCPQSADCSSTALFRAPAGSLQTNCPPGSFAVGPVTGRICERCTRGYYCGGGQAQSATRIACSAGKTTMDVGSVSEEACVCASGYRFDAATSSCLACSMGSFKVGVGNVEECTQCPEGYITYQTGSVSNSSCVEEISPDSSNSSIVQSEASVPSVSFNFSLSGLSASDDPEKLRQQLIEMFQASLSATTRIDPSAIQIDFAGLLGSGRRLLDLSTIVITIKTRSEDEAQTTAADLDVSTVSNEITSAVAQNPTLAASGLQLNMTSAPKTVYTVVKCAASRSIPPGVPVQSEADCRCSPGFGYNPAEDVCSPCGQGEYKADIANSFCTTCPMDMSTQNVGATSLQQCKCQAGLYDEGGSCQDCPEGFYCQGDGQAIACPRHSTTTTERKVATDCICMAGYYYVSVNGSQDTNCRPCDPRSYKPNVGNGECPLTCPTNADSELASTSLADCFCEPGFYASIDSTTMRLARCIPCTFQGLDCRGGFENRSEANDTSDRVHAMPVSLPGFFQTGLTTAVECDVLLPDGTSACVGGELCVGSDPKVANCNGAFGNLCAEGSTGMLCGACPYRWARDDYPDYCQPCPDEAASALVAGILSDIFQKTALNFVVAVMAATSAVKGGSKLHTSMIRIGTQWLAACSVLTEFNLDRLPGFGWSQEQEKLQQLQACADANITDCDTSKEASKFPWPEEVTQAMDNVFAMMGVVPSLASVEFSARCHGEQLLPGDGNAKLVAPAVYFVFSPLIAMMGVVLICALVTYVAIPLLNKLGLEFNDIARRKRKREEAIKKLAPALAPSLEKHGLKWADIEESKVLEEATTWNLEHAAVEPDTFVSGKLAYNKTLALKMCLHKARHESQQESLCAEVGLVWDDFLSNPEILFCELSSESLHDAIIDQMSPTFLETMVLRALAWSLREKFQEIAARHDMDVEEVALAVAAAYDSPVELREAAADAARFSQLVEEECETIRKSFGKADVIIKTSTAEEETEPKVGLDLESLDFGLFTSFPRPFQLLVQCVPVFWVTLLAMWPELLSTFLKMIWCTPISEDNDRGFTIVKQRLLPNPDVVCWSSDHFVLALLAFLGLGIWCIGVPVLLFFRLYVLKDRQSPENFRKYGFFIQGFEPQYWWWDIIVKRFDILIMNLVTYTSIATEEKAKLLTFPIISGCALGISAWCQPFTNTQAEILDFLEMCLLSFRFTLFSMIAIMLIFNPSANATWVLAGGLVFLLSGVCAYFAIHVLAQFLKGSAADMEESEDEELSPGSPGSPEAKQNKEKMRAASAKQNPLLRFAGQAKKILVRRALPIVQEAEDEKFFLQWSVHSNKVSLVSAAELKEVGAASRGRLQRLVSVLKGLRAAVLRFGSGVQRQVMVKALSEFTTIWLDEFGQPNIPVDVLQVLGALTTTSKLVPHKTPLVETGIKWKQQVESLLRTHRGLQAEPVDHSWYISLDDMLSATQRLQKLGAKDAVIVVEEVGALLQSEKKRHNDLRVAKSAAPQALKDAAPRLERISEAQKVSESLGSPGCLGDGGPGGALAVEDAEQNDGPTNAPTNEPPPANLQLQEIRREPKDTKEMAVQTRVKSAAMKDKSIPKGKLLEDDLHLGGQAGEPQLVLPPEEPLLLEQAPEEVGQVTRV
eukprot:s881_g8.t2